MKNKREENALAALAHEIGRKKKFRSAGEGAVLAVLRTAGLLRRSLSAHFETAGVTMTQYNVLRILRGAPAGLPTLQIRRRMLEEAAGITRLVDRLEASGLIVRERPASDRRQVFCRITKQGLGLLEQTESRVSDFHAQLVSQLNHTEATELVGLLMKTIDSVRANSKKP
jgi:DNA-binding MarR family transcriptional regulator